MNKAKILNRFQRKLAQSKWAARLAIKLRNQANKVIGYSLAQTHRMDLNGEQWLIQKLAPHIEVAVDAGANVGEWSEMLLQATPGESRPEIHLFEPGETAFRCLQQKFGQLDKVYLNKTGLLEDDVEEIFFENHRLNRSSGFVETDSTDLSILRVPVNRLDSYCRRNKIDSIDFLKVDCEGSDLKVIRGCGDLLKNGNIRFIQFEYGAAWTAAGATLLQASQLLQKCGYRLFAIQPMSLSVINAKELGEFFQYSNFLAVHTDAEELLQMNRVY